MLIHAALRPDFVPTVREWMPISLAAIFANPSVEASLPPGFREPLELWAANIVEYGGLPLRAFFVATAIHFPEIWSAAGMHTLPEGVRPGLQSILEAFLLAVPGYETPAAFLLQCVGLIYAAGGSLKVPGPPPPALVERFRE